MIQSKTSKRSSLVKKYKHDPMFALGKYNAGTGANWCKKREAKKTKFNRTDGKLKGETCKASVLDKHFAKSSRAYRHEGYATWMEKTRGIYG